MLTPTGILANLAWHRDHYLREYYFQTIQDRPSIATGIGVFLSVVMLITVSVWGLRRLKNQLHDRSDAGDRA